MRSVFRVVSITVSIMFFVGIVFFYELKITEKIPVKSGCLIEAIETRTIETRTIEEDTMSEATAFIEKLRSIVDQYETECTGQASTEGVDKLVRSRAECLQKLKALQASKHDRDKNMVEAIEWFLYIREGL
jgi:hypothetical protein